MLLRALRKTGSVLLIIFVLAGFSPVHAQEKPNIIFITVDTLRPDHLGCYGYPEETSPHIDHLAGESLLFTEALTPIPTTTSSHASIFTALYPAHHGSLYNLIAVDKKNELLAEILRDNGYRTAAFVSSICVAKQTGLAGGFEFFDDRSGFSFRQRNIFNLERKAGPTIRQAEKWVKAHGDAPFFVWIHLYDAHKPYHPPARFVRDIPANMKSWKNLNKRIGRRPRLSDKEKSTVTALYDGEIRYMDRQLGFFMEFLKRKNLYKESVIIFMSDHGEILGEKNNYYGHHEFVYEPSVRIPLLMKLPKTPPQRIDPMIRSIDVMPTLLSYLEIKSKNPWDGRDLWPAIQKKQHDGFPKFCYIETPSIEALGSKGRLFIFNRFVSLFISASRRFFGAPIPESSHLFSALISGSKRYLSLQTPASSRFFGFLFSVPSHFSKAPRNSRAYSEFVGVRTRDWKYCKNSSEEHLFYLGADPEETLNLAGKNLGKKRQLQSLFYAYKNTRASLISSKNPWKPRMTDGAEEKARKEKISRLKSLGYL